MARRQWVRAFPDSYDAWESLGDGYDLLGDYAKAQRVRVEAVSLNSDNPGAWYKLGKASAFISEYDQAINAYLKAIKLHNPNDPQILSHAKREGWPTLVSRTISLRYSRDFRSICICSRLPRDLSQCE